MNIEYHTSIPKTYVDSGKKDKTKKHFFLQFCTMERKMLPVLPLDALAQELEL